MKALHMIAFTLLVIGGLNWLIIGFYPSWNLANYLGMTVAQIIYILVGLSALYEAFTHKKNCMTCKTSPMSSTM
jgi:uncharacterized membrane protein YuzA (DUF378 family)